MTNGLETLTQFKFMFACLDRATCGATSLKKVVDYNPDPKRFGSCNEFNYCLSATSCFCCLLSPLWIIPFNCCICPCLCCNPNIETKCGKFCFDDYGWTVCGPVPGFCSQIVYVPVLIQLMATCPLWCSAITLCEMFIYTVDNCYVIFI